MNIHRLLVSMLLAVAMLGFGAMAQEADPQPEMIEEVVVQVAESEEFGQYLTDAEGNPLYVFVADEELENEVFAEPVTEGMRDAVVPCTDDCLEAWPGLFAEFVQAGEGVNDQLLYTITNMQGFTQVVYNGLPLYRFTQDQAGGQAAGQGVESFGGTWYLVGVDGTPLIQGAAMGGGATDDAADDGATDDGAEDDGGADDGGDDGGEGDGEGDDGEGDDDGM